MRREQETVDGHDGRVEAKCGIVENNENDRYDNGYNEDHVEDDIEPIAYCLTPYGFLLPCCDGEKNRHIDLKISRR